jgi:carbonic anhydrase
MGELISINSIEDILPEYRKTPIGLLLEYHNLNRPFNTYDKAELLVGMCMDNRKHLNIPDNFAFIIRAGGANLRYSEFKVSYAIAVGQSHCAYCSQQLRNG